MKYINDEEPIFETKGMTPIDYACIMATSHGGKELDRGLGGIDFEFRSEDDAEKCKQDIKQNLNSDGYDIPSFVQFYCERKGTFLKVIPCKKPEDKE